MSPTGAVRSRAADPVHELSLCGAIADIVTRRAEDRSVEVIHVRIGQLRQVVPNTLAFCWEMMTAQTALEGSVLEMERVAALLHCNSCGQDARLGASITLACQLCGALDVDVLTGEEFDVAALDLMAV
jgi:hydrogenase nickel incorporation protein HypA/HybF